MYRMSCLRLTVACLIGNTAEVSSKNSAQHTAVSIIGLALSFPFATFACRDPVIMWPVYASLTIIHVVSNYKLMRILRLRSLNLARSSLLIQAFYDTVNPIIVAASESRNNATLANGIPSVLSMVSETRHPHPPFSASDINQMKVALDAQRQQFEPKHIAEIEPILSLLLPAALRCPTRSLAPTGFGTTGDLGRVHIWTPPSKVLTSFSRQYCSRNHQSVTIEQQQRFSQHFADAVDRSQSSSSPYVVIRDTDLDPLFSQDSSSQRGKENDDDRALERESRHNHRSVWVCFAHSATAEDALKALFTSHAYVIRGPRLAGGSLLGDGCLSDECLSDERSTQLYALFRSMLVERHWDLNRLLLRPQSAVAYKSSPGW